MVKKTVGQLLKDKIEARIESGEFLLFSVEGRPNKLKSYKSSQAEELHPNLVQYYSQEDGKLKRGAQRFYVERREQGDYAVRTAHAERASAVLPTQREAIAWAKKRSSDKPVVERVRNTRGSLDKWRKT